MKKLLISISILMIFSLVLPTSKPIEPKDYQRMMGIGINVNWVTFKKIREQFLRHWERGISVAKLFKDRGFSHVRIRADDDVLKDPKALKALKVAVDSSLKAGLIPVVAYSAKDFINNPSEKTMREAINWWKFVAGLFKGYPYELSYDLIIETGKNIRYYDDLLNEFYELAVSEIRKIDPYRMIFITPNGTSNPCYLDRLKLPKDRRYLMIQWHFYASGPSKKNPKKLWTTGTEEEKKLIIDKIECALKWAKEHGMYTWVGAWMASNYNKSHRERRFPDGAPAGGDYSLDEIVSFASFMSKALKSRGIPFAINADNKYFDMENLRWYRSVSRVLDVILDP